MYEGWDSFSRDNKKGTISVLVPGDASSDANTHSVSEV